MWCCAISDEVWNVVMRCGMMVWCMGNMVGCAVMQDVKCGCGIPSDVEWFDAILDTMWCGMMVEMQCGKCDAVCTVRCGIVWCVIYIWMWWWAWCGARWNVGVMWNGVPRCVAIWCELWCNVKCGVMCMWNVVWCGMLQFQVWCEVEHVAEMQNVWCGIWRVVECGVLVYGMLHNARCGKLRCDVKCGSMELGWWRMWHIAAMCCVIVVWCLMWKMTQCVVMSDVVAWCKIKMWWCNVIWNMVWCELCCDVECGCGVE